MRPLSQIVSDLNSFKPEDGNWLKLDALLGELWETGNPGKEIRSLFNLFERFPEDDGAGVLWGVLHGIESFESYEQELLDSLNRQPSHLGVIMLRRIVNTGTRKINGIDLEDIVIDLMNNKLAPESVKEDIKELLE